MISTPTLAAGRGVQPWVFWPAAGVILAFSGFAILAPAAAEALFAGIQVTIVDAFSWYYVLIAAIFVAIAIMFGFSRFGDIKLGRDDDEPEFSIGAWFSLLFAAGMGIGLVFYGVSEPLSHFVSPRPGVTGEDPALAQAALTQTYLHWGVTAWSIYVIVGLSLAYAIHRRGRPISIRWTLEPVLGRKRVEGPWGHAIDVVALAGTVFGVATSLGLGVLQISAGLDAAGIAEPSEGLQVLIIGVITVCVLASVLSGVTRGMKWLSSTNLVLAGLLLLYILIFGQTEYLLREWVQSIGSYIQNFVGLSFTVSAFQGEAGEAWQASWTSFYWGWWISWAPFVGIFIARVSRGRTVREFITCVLVIPTVVSIIWMSTFGGSAIDQVIDHGNEAVANSEQAVMLFEMLRSYPMTQIASFIGIVLVMVFFVTSSDSGSLVIDTITSGGIEEPPVAQRVFWATFEGVVAIVLLIGGGLGALQAAAVTTGVPFAFLLIVMMWSLWKGMSEERKLSKNL